MTDHPTLLAALLAVQEETPTLPKDGTNPHYGSKFTKLDTIVEKIGPILQKHGLVWTTKPCRDEHGDPALKYKLAHVPSGESEEDTMSLLLTKEDPQSQGSAITYARRYALTAVLNLVADEDDDGHAGSQGQRKSSGSGKPSEGQQKLIADLAKQKGLLVAQLAQLASEVVGAPVTIEEGWVQGHLTGGRDGTASALIDRLMKGPIPEAESTPTPVSDVPDDADGFAHSPADGVEVPWTEAPA